RGRSNCSTHDRLFTQPRAGANGHCALTFDRGKLAQFWLKLGQFKTMIQSTDRKISRARCHAQPVVKFRLIPLVIPCCFLVAMTLLGCRSVQVDPAEEAVKHSDQLYQVETS